MSTIEEGRRGFGVQLVHFRTASRVTIIAYQTKRLNLPLALKAEPVANGTKDINTVCFLYVGTLGKFFHAPPHPEEEVFRFLVTPSR